MDEFLLGGRQASSWVQKVGVGITGSAFVAYGLLFFCYALAERSVVIGGVALCCIALGVRILVRKRRARSSRAIHDK